VPVLRSHFLIAVWYQRRAMDFQTRGRRVARLSAALDRLGLNFTVEHGPAASDASAQPSVPAVTVGRAAPDPQPVPAGIPEPQQDSSDQPVETTPDRPVVAPTARPAPSVPHATGWSGVVVGGRV
jgi:hypothetical protein